MRGSEGNRAVSCLQTFFEIASISSKKIPYNLAATGVFENRSI